LWQQLPGHGLVVWFALMSANQASRFLLFRLFRGGKLQNYQIRWRARWWAIGAGISGVLWGATAVFFFTPESPMHQAILVILVFGATTAAVPLIASHLPSLYSFLLPALAPFIVLHLHEGDAAHVALGLILFALTLGLVSFGRNYNRLIVTALRNRYEKQAFADQLAAQNIDLERARIAAEQADRSKTQFFAAASHDLRQPLHAMGLFASALAGKVHEPAVAKLVVSVNSSVQALEALFDELLDISKLDSGVMKPSPRSFAVNEVFDRLRHDFTAEAAAKGLGFTIAPTAALVYSDPVLVERVLRNLIANAVRYTETGAVTVDATPVDSSLRIEVRDTGVGIRTEDQQRIFDEFFQLGNPGRTGKKGLGLGLSIVKRMCDLLGCRIRVRSEFGQGSTFGFDVALSAAPPEVAAATNAAADDQADLAGGLVVVIDDEDAIVAGMRALLEGWGAQVIGSTTGDDVIAAVHAAGRLPDLLIIDYRLGIYEDGIEMAQRIRQELDPEIPALLVTGSITPELKGQARAAGLEFLLKPVTARDLRQRIAAALGMSLPVGGAE
jgi:signal transduction histidine kinase